MQSSGNLESCLARRVPQNFALLTRALQLTTRTAQSRGRDALVSALVSTLVNALVNALVSVKSDDVSVTS